MNAVRDRLAAAQIEIQQKEDEIEMKNREIDELVGEHERIVETVNEQWKGEVDEVKGQLEELRDVSLIIVPSFLMMTQTRFIFLGP